MYSSTLVAYGNMFKRICRLQYNITKKEDGIPFDMTEGRIGSARKKTPEELAREMNADDDGKVL